MDEFERRKKLIEELVKDELYVPMKIKELAIFLQVPKEQRQELAKVLDSLVEEGRIGLTKRGKYTKVENTSYTGVYESTKRGFGFVTVEGMDDDIFIPRLICLIGDLLWRKSLFCTLLLDLFHVFIYQIVDVHLVQLTVDQQLLDTSYNSTCDPVNTKTYRECETEYS